MKDVTLRPVAPFRASMHRRLSVSLPTMATLVIAIWYLPAVFVEIPRSFLGYQLVVCSASITFSLPGLNPCECFENTGS
jgi:hypothetical protein